MKDKLNQLAEGYHFYSARRAEYNTGENLSFRISPEPLQLRNEERESNKYGRRGSTFFERYR
jgi:hypothetical protein